MYGRSPVPCEQRKGPRRSEASYGLTLTAKQIHSFLTLLTLLAYNPAREVHMKLRMRNLALALLILLTVLVAAEDHATLTGRVTSSAGTPVDGAVIILRPRLSSGSHSLTSVEASKSGDFSLTLPSGLYDMFVSATCFVPTAQLLSIPPSGHIVVNRVMQSGPEICDVEVTSSGGVPTDPTPLPDHIEPNLSPSSHTPW